MLKFSAIREIATRDYICRKLSSEITKDGSHMHNSDGENRGWHSEKGGKFRCDTPGQQVIEVVSYINYQENG